MKIYRSQYDIPIYYSLFHMLNQGQLKRDLPDVFCLENPLEQCFAVFRVRMK